MKTGNSYLICNNFRGIKKGLFSNSMITATDMQNVELFDTGINSGVGIRTMKGNNKVFEFAEGENIINVFQSMQKSEPYCFIHTETDTEGKIYLYNPVSDTAVLKVDGLTLTGKSCGVDFAQGWSDLFIFSNGEELLSVELGHYNNNSELDEVTMMELTDTENNPVKGLGLAVFDGRLWIFNGVRLVYSVKEDCYDFSTSSAGIVTSAGYIEFVKKITAITPYIGTLAVFHKDSSCQITINEDYSYSKTDESPGGCAGMDSLVFHGANLFFYDDTKKSIFAFSQIINGDKTLVDNIAKDVQDEFFSISSSDFDKIKLLSVIESDHNEIWFLLPDGSDYSTILIYDYSHSQWVKRKSQNLGTIAIFNQKLYSSSGNKLLEEYSGNSFDGEFIESYYTCSPFNMGVDNTRKILYIPPRLTRDMTKQNHFMVRYVRNYDEMNKVKHKEIKAKTLKNIFTWDVSLWDSDDVWKPKETNSIKRLPISTFKTLEIKFYTKELDEGQEPQGFAIKNLELSRIKVKQV